MPQVSVIVPVYKAENEIERCVKSIVAQTYEDLELILVEDGSPDRSGEICDTLAKSDARIRVIHKENGGVSSARNAGLDVAKGRYVCFCDADDALPSEAIRNLITAMQDGNAQLVIGDFTSVLIDKKKNRIRTTENVGREFNRVAVHDADAMFDVWEKNNMLSACGKLYCRDIILEHNLRFCTNMVVMEDYAFVIDYISKCKNICMIPETVYTFFSVMGDSVESKRSRSDFFDDVLVASQKLDAFVTAVAPKWADKFQQETIYPTLKLAYDLLWSIKAQNPEQRKQKYMRIARATANKTAQHMFSFYRDRFTKMQYFFIKRGNIWGIRVCCKLRQLL